MASKKAKKTTEKLPAKPIAKNAPRKTAKTLGKVRAATKDKPVGKPQKVSATKAGKASASSKLPRMPSREKTSKKLEPTLLSGGNPQIAKADGDAPVKAYIAALPGWKNEVGKRLDAIISRAVPGVRKAVKWNSPFYGSFEKSYFLSFHAFSRYLKVAFFNGTSLRPMPPGESKNAEVRYLDLYEKDTLDEAQFEKWVKRAASLPGWTP